MSIDVPIAPQALRSSFDDVGNVWFKSVPHSARSLKLREEDKIAINEHILASTILIVDDCAEDAIFLTQCLTAAGFRNVHSESRPDQAVARVNEIQPDLIVLDLDMPEMSGVQLIALLVSEEARLHVGPLLVLTVDTIPEEKVRALGLESSDFQRRPIQAPELCMRVSNLLTRHVLQIQIEVQNARLHEMVEARTMELEQSYASLELAKTEHNEANESLRNAEEKLRLLLISSGSQVFSATHTPPYGFTFISDNVESQTGYSSKEFTDDPNFWINHVHPDDAATYLESMPSLILKGQFVAEYRFMHKDGSYHWMSSDRVVIPDADGQPIEVIGTWTNISDRKSVEEALAQNSKELSAANSRLLEFDRLKSEFVSTASHEMRTPLTVIREFANLLADGAAGETPEEQADSCQAILRNCDRLTGMLDYLLDFQRIEAGKLNLRRERVSLREALHNCQTDLLPRCEGHGLDFVLEVDEPLPFVIADEEQIVQVLVNIVGNATKFTPPGGSITLKAEPCEEGILISVTDTGRGIAPENLQTIFEAFRQIDRDDGPGFRGTGLGLTISNRIVTLHGGILSVESALGQGSRFSFTIPAWSEIGGLEALVNDKGEGFDGPMSILFVRSKDDGASSATPEEALAELMAATKAALRVVDDGVALPSHDCVAFVVQCDLAGASSAIQRFSSTLPSQLSEGTKVSFHVVELLAKQMTPSILQAAFESPWQEIDSLER